LILLLATSVTLAACGGGEPAPTSLSRLPMLSPHPPAIDPPEQLGAPAATASPRPMRSDAIEVVKRYYQVFNSLHRSMDAAALAALLTPSCPCQAQVDAIRRAVARGEHYVDRASVNVMRTSVQDSRHAYVLVNLDTGPGGLVAANGRRVTSAPARHGVQRVFRLVRHGRRWSIAAIEAG
jgi:hypothetical protein